MEIKTSAGRLLNIIEESKKIPGGTRCIDAWAKILDTNTNNLPLLFKRLGSVMSLPSQIEKVLSNTKGMRDPKPYLKWLSPINTAFMHQNLSSTWDTFSKYIDEHTINYLSVTVDMLNIQSPETTIEDEKLKELKIDFINIEKEINELELDIDLKNFMNKRIKDILNAIDEYKFNGIEPLIDALNITVGQVILNNELAIKCNSNNFAKKFWNLIVNTSVIVTLATGLPQIPDIIKNSLPLIQVDSDKNENSSQNKDLKQEQIIDVETMDHKGKNILA